MPENTPDRTEELLAQAEALIETAHAKCRETTELLNSLGLERGAARRFLESTKGNKEEKAKALADLAELKREIEQELAQKVEVPPSSSQPASAPPMSMRARMVRV